MFVRQFFGSLAAFALTTTSVVQAAEIYQSGFGQNGTVIGEQMPADYTRMTTFASAALPDNKILLAGKVARSSPTSVEQSALWRLNADGTVDTSFGDHGFKILDLSALRSELFYRVAVERDGSIWVTGYEATWDDAAPDETIRTAHFLLKMNADGSEDSSWRADNNHRLWLNSVVDGFVVLGIVVDNHGITLAGRIEESKVVTKSAILRLKRDGSRDESFANNGLFDLGAQLSGTHQLSGIVQSDDGGYVAAGVSEDSNGTLNALLVRIDSKGKLVSEFGQGNGFVIANFSGNSSIDELVVLPNKNIAVAAINEKSVEGVITAELVLAQFTEQGQKPVGSVDTVVSIPGRQVYGLTEIMRAADGALWVSGTSKIYGGPLDEKSFTARFKENGELDSTFANNGVDQPNLNARYNRSYSAFVSMT